MPVYPGAFTTSPSVFICTPVRQVGEGAKEIARKMTCVELHGRVLVCAVSAAHGSVLVPDDADGDGGEGDNRGNREVHLQLWITI